jgi:hypothetical protein
VGAHPGGPGGRDPDQRTDSAAAKSTPPAAVPARRGGARGRCLRARPAHRPVASRTAPDKSTLAEQLATGEHLGRVEVFLTTFRAAARNGQAGTISAADARRLLSTTRLFLDSPGGQDPRLRPLLEDLELVLAEITQLPGSTPDDLNLITEGLDRRGTLSRLRSAVPAGSPPVSQGES